MSHAHDVWAAPCRACPEACRPLRTATTELTEHTEPGVRLDCACGGCVFCSPGADVPVRCGFCHSPLVPADALSADRAVHLPVSALHDDVSAPPPRVRRRLFLAEIVCLLCGRETGTALSEHWPPTGPILFEPPDTPTVTLVRAWWRIRCTVCGGNTAATEVTIRTVRIEPAIDWRTDRPRRGRPPKWLVEQRRNAGPGAA